MADPTSPPFGVILVNLGTPDEPSTRSVRRYLAQFLSDPRVIHKPRLLWWCVLHGIILRIRPGKVAKLYQSIWTDSGSPLLAISQKQQAALQKELTSRCLTRIPVTLAMTYGKPALSRALEELNQQGISRILVLPMYPQYSGTTTAAVFDALASAVARNPNLPELIFIRNYWQREDYLDALSNSVTDYWDQHGRPDKLLMSFHGIPQSYEQKGDPYATESRETAKALANRLKLEPTQWSESFQSRFGPEQWLQPYTDKLLEKWGKDPQIQRVDVVCPAFSADCLETLEEISEQNRDLFLEAGGKSFHYIPCLNDREDHISMLANLILDYGQAWLP